MFLYDFLIFTKVLLELANSTKNDFRENSETLIIFEKLNDNELYIFSITVICLSIALMYYFNLTTLNCLISMFEQLKSVPAYQASCIVGSTLCGGIILNEFW